jgi:hypothetical protein
MDGGQALGAEIVANKPIGTKGKVIGMLRHAIQKALNAGVVIDCGRGKQIWYTNTESRH